MDDKKRFKALRAFAVKEALANSPELKALDARIAAKDRDETSKLRAAFVPVIIASAGVSHRFLRGGAGTEPQATALFPPNNFNWQFGVTASLPLYEGNLRYARRKRVTAELRQLETQRKSNAQVIATTVRQSLHLAGASWRAIKLTRTAAGSAVENLELGFGELRERQGEHRRGLGCSKPGHRPPSSRRILPCMRFSST